MNTSLRLHLVQNFSLYFLIFISQFLVFFFFLPSKADQYQNLINEPIQPLPQNINLNTEKVALGERLFHDPILSKDNSISCSTCHSLNKAGTDGLTFSKGIHRSIGDANTPTVFNSSFNFRQFWDGRAKTLAEQLDGPITNPKEMGSSWEKIVIKLKTNHKYVETFTKVYSDGITEKNIKNAIVTFEQSLITPNSRFDQYLRGNVNAITKIEKKGYQLFKQYGCISCHQGINVGGNMFQNFGIFETPPSAFRNQKFKVPSLRNVALTAPYFHNGSADTLEDAVKTMAKYQLGRTLKTKDLNAIVNFLKTLTGKYKGVYLDKMEQ